MANTGVLRQIRAASEVRSPGRTWGRAWLASGQGEDRGLVSGGPGLGGSMVVAHPTHLAMAGSHFFCKNTSGSMPACLRMARSVPSGMSPGWLGMVV